MSRASAKKPSRMSAGPKSRMSVSPKSANGPHGSDCEFCGDQTGPCRKAIKALREELVEYLDKMFEARQRSFIKFIENDLNIEEQVDPRGENVLNTFYKNHNTVNKMYDNFRLCK